MKPKSYACVFTLVLSFFLSITTSWGQSFGTVASAVWISDCNQSNYFNTSGSGVDLIGPSANVFANVNMGVHTQNSGTLIVRGASVKTFKNVSANVCNVRVYYRAYLQTASPGVFDQVNLPLTEDCNAGTGQYPSGGTCNAGDQKWSLFINDGQTTPLAPIDLTTFAPGNYVMELYYEISGASSSTSLCNETLLLNNGGANYKAFFSIQSPVLASSNPTSCNGTEGTVTISGLVPGTTYAISYTDDGVAVGPNNIVANGAGQVVISGLNAGVYSDFELSANGCTTNLNTGLILSNPVLIPRFNKIAPFCAGSTPPTLPSASTNGISGTWSPSVINNQTSGSYTFTPVAGQCGTPVTINVTVNPNKTPMFSFGSSLTICAGGAVPTLPTTSTNGINGSWSPATVSNTASANYTFTPATGQCATTTGFSVTVNPNITPSFSFGTTLTICSGASVPSLPATSDNGITGVWSPSTIDNTTSGSYTFTPSGGQCATTATFTVTVNPKQTPVFGFGTSQTICAGAGVPLLPNTSDNGITGVWGPSVVDNTASGVYTFTPSAGQCANTATFSLTVTPNVTPTFSFGSSLTICAGGTVPTLPTTSTNGINGSWSPATVSNTASANYTFTPTAGQCATATSFSVTVNPNITPSFSFGTTLTICSGASVPSLPATSDNGITGVWTPSAIDNTTSGSYTFTPSAGQCATTASLSVTVNPNITPAFSFGTSTTICDGDAVPTLPGTSSNGLTGVWNPSVIDNQASATYTFTPSAGQCATTATFAVTVTAKTIPAFSFGTSLSICAGGVVPTLTNTSTNAITGTWSPSVVDNSTSAVYTFTPDAGQCAATTTFSVTVNPVISPSFSFGSSLTICAGAVVPVLPTTSTNGIAGSWSPAAVDNQASGSYSFTPAAGQCATTATFVVTVNSNTTPTFSFGSSLTICAGAPVPSLPATSTNGITGTWNPSSVDNQNSGTYTFTPSTGQCATTTTFTVTVNPNTTPTFSFGTSLAICAGGVAPMLPATSSNGITGTWSPSVVDNSTSAVYTFTPSAGLCATITTLTVTVNPIVTPTFNFGASLVICAGSTTSVLPASSNNGISGTWSPSVIDNQNSASYTFTPSAGQCATTTTLSVTVNPNITPTFSFGTSLTICAGGAVPALTNTSDNGINGAWSAPTVSNQNSGTYTFTPSPGQCATTTTFIATVNPNVTPAFSFGTSLTICAGGVVPALPVTSSNGITGTWSPSVVDNSTSAVYTFTPSAGLCATATTFTVTVNPNLTPIFSFGTSLTICSGTTVPSLPTTSDNGISGVWSPSVVSNQTSGTYSFTPSAGQCATNTSFSVTVTPTVVPGFSFGTTLSICAGGNVPQLPTVSDNGVSGVWSPAVASNQSSGVYTFIPTAMPGQCIATTTFTITVNPIVTPTFGFGTALTVCPGSMVPVLPATSQNGVNGTWSPAAIDNQASGVYTFTAAAGQCATPTITLTVTIPPMATVAARTDTTINDGVVVPLYSFSGAPAGVSYNWTNSNSSIGLAASGTGNVPSFTAINKGSSPVNATVTVTPKMSGCSGTARSYVIHVLPLDKDVFVPNVFSPNGDGKNDVLFVYGNYIDKVDLRIFNQWGELVEKIDNKTRGWDGRYKGQPQPVGVYVYVLQATLADGRTVKLKGNITLLR